MEKWTQADYEKLKRAVASGVLSVRYDGPPGRTVTYQSLDAMRSLLAEMRREIAGTPAHRYIRTSKGFR